MQCCIINSTDVEPVIFTLTWYYKTSLIIVIMTYILPIGAIVSFIAYYIIGLPLGILLGFKTNLGLLGVWLGMLLGNITHVSTRSNM